MDGSTMVELNKIYIKILKNGQQIYNKSHGDLSIKTAEYLESYSSYIGEMNEKIENILELTEKYAKECLIKANEIRIKINSEEKSNSDQNHMIRAHKELYFGLSWGEISEIDDEKDQVLEDVEKTIGKQHSVDEYTHNPIIYKNLSSIYGTPIGFDWKIPIISKITEIPPSLYWYNGDSYNPAGIYTCLSRDFYVQVPFPNVVDATQDFNRTGSIKCKYNSLNDCKKAREDLASKYKSEMRECKFAHKGDNYIKIGTTFRCQNKPRFGNHYHLKDDINEINNTDIKSILMYALSDVLLSSIWFQKQNNSDSKSPSMILSKIDKC